MLFAPNQNEEFGHQLLIENSTVQFEPLMKYGDKSYVKGNKAKWLEILPKMRHAEQKLLVLPYY